MPVEPGIGMPGQRLLALGLAEAVQVPDAAAVGVKPINIVADHELAAVPIQLLVSPKEVLLVTMMTRVDVFAKAAYRKHRLVKGYSRAGERC
jgi:hypothetical protein